MTGALSNGKVQESSRERLGVRWVRGKGTHRFPEVGNIERGWTQSGVSPVPRQPPHSKTLRRFERRVCEGSVNSHDAITPPFCNAAITRSGVSGRFGTRTPQALATALAMAAPGETTGGSPMPMTPRSS